MRGWITVDRERHLAVRFDATDLPVHEVYVGEIRSDGPVEVIATLSNGAGRTVWEGRLRASAVPQRKHWRLETPIAASHLILTLRPSQQHARVRLSDMRVQGQPPALRAYLDATLDDLHQ